MSLVAPHGNIPEEDKVPEGAVGALQPLVGVGCSSHPTSLGQLQEESFSELGMWQEKTIFTSLNCTFIKFPT